MFTSFITDLDHFKNEFKFTSYHLGMLGEMIKKMISVPSNGNKTAKTALVILTALLTSCSFIFYLIKPDKNVLEKLNSDNKNHILSRYKDKHY